MSDGCVWCVCGCRDVFLFVRAVVKGVFWLCGEGWVFVLCVMGEKCVFFLSRREKSVFFYFPPAEKFVFV